MIDLGKEYGKTEMMAKTKAEPKVDYPTLYVSGVDKLELPDGEFDFSGRGKVVSKTESTRDGKTTCSYEIQVMGIEPEGAAEGKDKNETSEVEGDERLDKELTKLSQQKDMSAEEDDSEE